MAKFKLWFSVVVGGHTLNIIIAYALQSPLDEEVKKSSWEELDEVVRCIPRAK